MHMLACLHACVHALPKGSVLKSQINLSNPKALLPTNRCLTLMHFAILPSLSPTTALDLPRPFFVEQPDSAQAEDARSVVLQLRYLTAGVHASLVWWEERICLRPNAMMTLRKHGVACARSWELAGVVWSPPNSPRAELPPRPPPPAPPAQQMHPQPPTCYNPSCEIQ